MWSTLIINIYSNLKYYYCYSYSYMPHTQGNMQSTIALWLIPPSPRILISEKQLCDVLKICVPRMLNIDFHLFKVFFTHKYSVRNLMVKRQRSATRASKRIFSNPIPVLRVYDVYSCLFDYVFSYHEYLNTLD